jgi:hypothetical protein
MLPSRTARQKAIYDFPLKTHSQKGFAPSLVEAILNACRSGMKGTNYNSKSTTISNDSFRTEFVLKP